MINVCCSTTEAADGAAIALVVEPAVATMLVATNRLLVNAPPSRRLLQPRAAEGGAIRVDW